MSCAKGCLVCEIARMVKRVEKRRARHRAKAELRERYKAMPKAAWFREAHEGKPLP